jgi:SAM-dependent methyltransferase
MPSTLDHADCPLCRAARAEPFCRDSTRAYLRCAACGLTFVPRQYHLSSDEEKSRYDLHQNSPDDEGYRAFLSRLFTPLAERVAPGSRGLDFGSGPGPTLSLMFEEAGHHMRIYDRYYAGDRSALEGSYDFITASEVVEHLRDPRGELEMLWSILAPGGWLGIMTTFVPSDEALGDWHYLRDDTHICFYARRTFDWLAQLWSADLVIPEANVALFRKNT